MQTLWIHILRLQAQSLGFFDDDPETLCIRFRGLKALPRGVAFGEASPRSDDVFCAPRVDDALARKSQPLELRTASVATWQRVSEASEFDREIQCRRCGTWLSRPRLASRRFFDALRSQIRTRPIVATIAVSRSRPHPTSAASVAVFAHTVRPGFDGCFCHSFHAVSV